VSAFHALRLAGLRIFGFGGFANFQVCPSLKYQNKTTCRKHFLRPAKSSYWQTLKHLSSHISSYLPPNNKGCLKPEAYCSSALSNPKYKE
jgi:hypothetical protein